MKSGDEIDAHLEHFGLASMRQLAAGPCCHLSDKAVERRLTRGIHEKRYASYPLYGSTKYYTLTKEAARARGIFDVRAGFPFAYQALCLHYAMSGSGTMTDLPKVRLTRDEFAQKLPMLMAGPIKHFRTRYFLDRSEREHGLVRVGLFVVDMGQHVRNVARKVRREVERRQHNAFRELVAHKLLTICVLTVTEKKAEQIRASLVDLPVTLRVEVIPGYRELIIWKG